MKRVRFFETLLYASILLLALSLPFFTGIFEYEGWNGILRNWLRLLPLVLIFLMHNFFFAPKLLFSGKYLFYILSCIISVAAVVYLFGLLSSVHRPFNMMQPPPNMPFPQRKMPPLPNMDFPFMRRQLLFNFGQAIIAVLLIGFNIGIKSFVRGNEERERQSERERQYLHTELAFLKHQISPHFFMNTLNNIHSLIDINTEKARDAIVKLSRLMRYMLYEADVENVSLKKEIEFIESYIELMRLRYNEDVLTVEIVYPAVMEEIYVPSFLFLSFIENSFKHGVVLNEHSLINIQLAHENGRLIFTVCNKKSGVVPVISEASGIGLENVRKRLDLIFKDDYTITIHSTEDSYMTYLNIPV